MATVKAMTSAKMMEYQIPSIPNNNGSKSTARISNTRVRKNEIVAEIRALFRAVKKKEPKIAAPANRKEKEYMKNPRSVMESKSLS